MKVKIFDESHELDLENSVNAYLSTITGEVVDIKYQVSTSMYRDEQIFCFSCMIIYT